MDLLDKMATYVRVLEAGSFSAAAVQLRISAAAVSRQIATLEAELGTTLLLRTTRRMTVTPKGRQYYERCLRILRDVEDAQTMSRSTVEGPLRVSAPLTFGLARVVPHLHALMAANPALRIELRVDDRLVDLVLDDIDVAIRVGSTPPETTELVAQQLTSFHRVLVASPAYLRRRGVPKTPEALAKHDALAGSDQWMLRREREVRVQLRVVFRSNAPDAVRVLCLDGAGIALLPEWIVREHLELRALRPVLAGWRSDAVHVYALYRRASRGQARVRALIEHLRAAYGVSAAAPR